MLCNVDEASLMYTDIEIRNANSSNAFSIVALLADDPLGAKRGCAMSPLPQCYYDAFAMISADRNNEMIATRIDDRIAGVLQLTFIPSVINAENLS